MDYRIFSDHLLDRFDNIDGFIVKHWWINRKNPYRFEFKIVPTGDLSHLNIITIKFDNGSSYFSYTENGYGFYAVSSYLLIPEKVIHNPLYWNENFLRMLLMRVSDIWVDDHPCSCPAELKNHKKFVPAWQSYRSIYDPKTMGVCS